VNNLLNIGQSWEGAGETVMGMSYFGGDVARYEENSKQGELRKQHLRESLRFLKGMFHCNEEPFICKISGETETSMNMVSPLHAATTDPALLLNAQ
jgi:hypothetical protein